MRRAKLEQCVDDALTASGGSSDGADALIIEDESVAAAFRAYAYSQLLLVRLTAARAARLRGDRAVGSTAALEHLREMGHELAYGCCGERVDARLT